MNKPTTIQTSSPLTLQPSASAFTLAEVMIVLAVIGILTAILLPVARNSTPNENILKFKKAHNTLHTTIRELVNSDKYYLNGDLGVKPNGDLIDGTHDGDYAYFCSTIAEIITTKKINCKSNKINIGKDTVQFGVSEFVQTNGKELLDEYCDIAQNVIGEEILLNDNVAIFQTSTTDPFGVSWATAIKEMATEEEFQNWLEENSPYTDVYIRLYSETSHLDDNGFPRPHKVICLDIDGINQGEYPFGYGIRYDGKIVNGARAEEWLQKSIQEN